MYDSMYTYTLYSTRAAPIAEIELIAIIFPLFTEGGCGAMYEIFVESEDFRGKRQVQQHRLVNKVSILYMLCIIMISRIKCIKCIIMISRADNTRYD